MSEKPKKEPSGDQIPAALFIAKPTADSSTEKPRPPRMYEAIWMSRKLSGG
jgi:hypothetical protein